MKFHLSTALAATALLALGATAQAQSHRSDDAGYLAAAPVLGDVATGRSAYAGSATPGPSIEANHTVMGLRTPDAQVEALGQR